MEPLTYARAQMGLSLAFHIVFAAAGVALPLLMVIADVLWLRRRDPDYRELSEKLAKGTAVLFAVGAVSGTVLSFELGLLWPAFMARFGDVIGVPFALEGFAFFTEAIFLGIYLYGRGRVSDGMHLAAGILVALSGAASAFFVTLVNAFMNNPHPVVAASAGAQPDPIAAMWSPSWPTQTVHVLLASYEAAAFAMAAIHAALLLRRRLPDARRGLHRKALAIALSVAAVTAVLQPLSGDRSAKHVAEAQPLKLAALEAQFTTEDRAPLRIGGIPDTDARRVHAAIEIPGGLSFLAFGDPNARVRGLEDFPADDWPPVLGVHLAFQVMVGAGTALAALALLSGLLALRRRGLPDQRAFLWALVIAGPLGFVALEAGWLVTEWGRQPWIVKGLMRTAQAVGSAPQHAWPFWIFAAIYLFLGFAVVFLLGKQIATTAVEPAESITDGAGADPSGSSSPPKAHAPV